MYELNNRGVELSIIGKLDEAIEVFTHVITSYSIHYTKLYEMNFMPD